ncbi:MAG: hypothetical protein KGY99_00260 [Phycisphaerae bacterium]|nr:hypothetical protein [Phycisphaerae bacterium]
MTRFWAIFRNTFVQTVRQPVFTVLIAVTFAVLVLNIFLAGWTMGIDYHDTDQKMLVNLNLSALLLSGLLVAAFSASGVLSREIDSRTALTVIAKPVPRGLFVIGKFAGVAAAVTVAFYVCALVFLLTVRHRVMSAASDPYDWPVIVLGIAAFVISLLVSVGGNLLFNWTFTSVSVAIAAVLLSLVVGVVGFVGKGWQVIPFGEGIDPQILLGLLLIWLAVIILVAVAVAASTRGGQVMTLLICLAALVLGSMYPFLAERWAHRLVLPRLAGGVLANLTYFYPLDALSTDRAIPGRFVALAAAYAGLYIAAVLTIGMALFQRRPLEAQDSATTLPGPVGLLGGVGRIAAIVTALLGLEGALSGLWKMINPTFLPLLGPSWAAALVVAPAAWMLWGHFSHGARWAYWLVLALSAAILATAATGLVLPDPAAETVRHGLSATDTLTVALIAAGIVALIVLPKTRRHFFTG